MGSVHGKKDESSEKSLHDGSEVINSLVPRKPRSAMTRRPRKNIVVPSWRKRRRVSNGIRKPSVKKLRLSKCEEEVANTLNSLAEMFTNTPEANKPAVLERSCNIADKIDNPPQLVVTEPKKKWKRCSTHVSIAHQINVLRKPETTLGLTLRPDFRAETSEALKQFHESYQQLRSNPTMSSSIFHGRTEAEEALQAKLSSSLEQQRLAAHSEVAILHLPEWQTRGSFFNEARAPFPHLHSAIGANFHLSPPQLRHMPYTDLSLSHHHFNQAFQRNGGA